MRALEWPFIGRTVELARLEQSAVAAVVIVGNAGVGKSRFMAEKVRRMAPPGRRTVLLRATRSTASIPFGVFAPWVPDGVGREVTGRLPVLAAIVRALVGGDDGVVVLAVDDAHLLDDASAAVLLHLVVHTPVRVAVTVRSGARCPDAVVALWKEGLAELVELDPLPQRDTLLLARSALGAELDAGAESRLWSLCTGVPLYLREVLRAAVDQGVLTSEGGVWRWQGDLTGGGRLSELLDDNLANAGADERYVIELVALGEPLPLQILDELGHLDALAAAERRGLVTVDSQDGQAAVRLTHPLYGEVLRADMPALVARKHHGDLAAVAIQVGWHERDPLRVATWCLDSGAVTPPPDFTLAAAHQALALAAWPLAERLARAAEKAGCGPEATLVRTSALVQLGGWGNVAEPLARLSPEVLDDAQLAQYTRFQAALLVWSQGNPAAARLALDRAAAGVHGSARARLLGDAAYNAILSCQPEDALRLARRVKADAGAATDLRLSATAAAAMASLLQGRTATALQLAESASADVASVVAGDPYPGNPAILMTAAHALALGFQGRFDEAATLASSARRAVDKNRNENLRAAAVALNARIRLFQGRLDLADRFAREALVATEPGPSSQWPAAVLITAAAQRGAVDTARDVLARAQATSPGVPLFVHELRMAEAWLTAMCCDLEGAQSIAREAATSAARTGVHLLEMLALLDVCRFGGAASVTHRLAELSRLVDGTYAAAAADYAVASAQEDGDGLDDVSARFEGMGALLLAAEAAAGAGLAHGQSERQHSQPRSWARARLLAAACDGAGTPALRSVVEPSPNTITRREREVLELAAHGLTNREIAGRLYISIRTVNAHLHHAYTKLGVNDRSRLATHFPLLGQDRSDA